MSAVARNQLRTFGRLWETIEPHVGRDRGLPDRIQKTITYEKRFGARDRRLYRELVYTAVRFWSWYKELALRSPERAAQAIVWLASPIPAVQPLKQTLASRWPELPDTLAEKARVLEVQTSLLPEWLPTECPAAAVSPNLDVLHRRAPLWLRWQTEDREAVIEEFRQREWKWRPSEAAPAALEMLGDVDVTQSAAFARGAIEVQDLGSQLVLASPEVAVGSRWLDACAGAGGKTLQLASLVGASGAIDAHDIRADALKALQERAARAGVRNIQITADPAGLYDGVLVDAPCSGSGTWRRAPHLKWTTSRDDIVRAATRQRELLGKFSARVRPGGLLVYATCSLAQAENEAVATAFLDAHAEFSPVPSRIPAARGATLGRTILPAEFNSDGFYVAVFRRA